MGKIFRIVIGECCGYRCAQLFEIAETADNMLQWAQSDEEDNWKWRRNHTPEKEPRLDWAMKLSAVKEALRRAVRDGQMTQEEADAELEKWLEENPDPGVPIDVTEVFGIPIKIVRREEVKVER